MDARYLSSRSRSGGSHRSGGSGSGSRSSGSSSSSSDYLSTDSPSSNSHTQPSTAATTPETDPKGTGKVVQTRSAYPLFVHIPVTTSDVAAEIKQGVDQTLANIEFDEFNQNRSHHEQMTREGHPLTMRKQPSRSAQILSSTDQDAAVKSTLAGTSDALGENLRNELLRAQHDILKGTGEEYLDVMDAIIDYNKQSSSYRPHPGTPNARSSMTASPPSPSRDFMASPPLHSRRKGPKQPAPIAYRAKADPSTMHSIIQIRAGSGSVGRAPTYLTTPDSSMEVIVPQQSRMSNSRSA